MRFSGTWPPVAISNYPVIEVRAFFVARVHQQHGDVFSRFVVTFLVPVAVRRLPMRGKCHQRDRGERVGETGENVFETRSVQTNKRDTR